MKKCITTQRRATKGFTLIELLVVIAIIAILAAILFPVFARARENARRTSCLSNLKQLGLGMMMYMQDYDAKYPARYYFSGAATPGTGSGTMLSLIVPPPSGASYANAGWLLEPYVKSRQLAVCPSWTGNLASYGGGYAYNLIAGVPSVYGGPDVLSEAQVEEASQMIAFVDGSWYRDAYPVAKASGDLNGNWKVNFCKDVQNGGTAKTCTGAAWGAEINTYGRHLDGVNASYMDGHAKWHKIDYFYNNGNNYPVWQGWK